MINQTLTDSFMLDLLRAVHDAEADMLKIALYGPSASLGRATTAYTTAGEIAASGYTAGGLALTNVTTGFENDWLYMTFDDPQWSGAFSAAGALIYNASKSNKSIAVLDFGMVRTSTTLFKLNLPKLLPQQAIIRFKR